MTREKRSDEGSPAILARRLERARAAEREAVRRAQQYKLTAMLALHEPGAIAVLHDERRMVELWRQNKTCRENYIEGWREIVREEPALAAKKIMGLAPEWINAMFQNTPFAFRN